MINLDPSRFSPGGTAAELIKEADASVQEINAHRPLPPEIVEQLELQLRYDRVYSSAAVEGSRLTRRETVVVLESGHFDRSRRDEREVYNLNRAVQFVDGQVCQGTPVTEGLIREIHKIVMDGIYQGAGEVRREDVKIAGSKTLPPAPGDVPALLQRVVSGLRNPRPEDEHPIKLAGWFHWALSRIHPFKDGNGRVARLAQDLILLQRRYVPVPLYPEDREGAYYEALEAADNGDGSLLLGLLAKNVLRVADRYLQAIREHPRRRDWLRKIADSAAGRVKLEEQRRYEQWQRRAALLRNEFKTVAQALSHQIPVLQVQLRDYGGIDFDQFNQIRQGERFSKTWLFGLEFELEDVRARYMFWAGRHAHRAIDPDGIKSPTLLVSVEGNDGYRLLDDLDDTEGHHVCLRELAFDGRQYCRRRHTESGPQWDTDVSAGDVVRDFFTEVLETLGLVDAADV